MREIKFRAWCSDENVIRYINQGLSTDINGIVSYKHYDKNGMVVTAPIMQFTGLKDSAGGDIYEGDILSDIIGYYVMVVFCESECRFGLVEKNSTVVLWMYPDILLKQFRVVGNIHENQELIK